MSEITFACPKCGINIQADESVHGTDVNCPKCDYGFSIPAPQIRTGLELGGFIVEKRLGKGGMGEVWLACQKTMDRKVAIKILSPSLTGDSDFVNRFIREVKTSAKLIHPNIVTAFDAGLEKGIYYLAVEYIEGEDLGQQIALDKILSEEEALGIVRGVAEGLAYAWNKFKILHRDIKPANIMICADGKPKLMDLGISKNLSDDSSMTMAGVIMGTPCYMSPEQAKSDRAIDFHTDIYSLGATLYHLVTGKIPFEGDSTVSIMTKHVVEPLECAIKKNPSLSRQCSALIDIMMKKDPRDRQVSWEEVIKDIDSVLAGHYPSGNKSMITSVLSSPRFWKTGSNLKAAAILSSIILISAITIAGIIVRNAVRRADVQRENVNKKEIAPPVKTDEPQLNKKNEENKTPPEKVEIPEPPKEAVLVKVEKTVLPPPQAEEPAPAEEKIEIKPEPKNLPPKAKETLSEQLSGELLKANPGLVLGKTDICERDGKMQVILKDKNLSDLTPLWNFPVTYLDISGTKVKDLSPLKGMQINNLLFSNTNVSDISPLKGMQIKRLEMSNSQVRDLSPLKEMPLVILAIDGVAVSDISPILGLKLSVLSLNPRDNFESIRDRESKGFMSREQISVMKKLDENLMSLSKMPSLKLVDFKMKPTKEMMSKEDFFKMIDAKRKEREGKMKSNGQFDKGKTFRSMRDK